MNALAPAAFVAADNRYPQTLLGKVAIVTGASSGIGRAAAIELARRGAAVVVSARRRAEIETLAAGLRDEGLDATALPCDVTHDADLSRLIAETRASYGRIDIAFNNAGTEGHFAPFLDQDDRTFDLVFEANVRGVFNAMRHEGRVMLEQGAGVIINNASMGGVIGFQNAAPYIASKHAVLGLTKTAALEWFARGVRVNALCPGIIDTPFQDRIWPSAEAKAAFAEGTVAGRAGTAEEMARVVAFLASDDAAFLSGHGLLADGGYSVA
ncbi:SDR family NAD(P)-dependent oxidoreductase [Brevundimonas aurifodinae]|uniref:Glucose 1-dehydrogenase n=1 Tax=Brevundimonas aurifodinae TaxID=1508312 RepID=A0ABV1NL07_9CAUL